MKEIKYEDLVKLPEESYVLIDIRDEGLRAYGMIPGAEAIDLTLDENIIKENIEAEAENMKEKKEKKGKNMNISINQIPEVKEEVEGKKVKVLQV